MALRLMQMTLRYMSDIDTHELIIREFIEYSKWSTRFELHGYKESAVKARVALGEIRRLIMIRRAEIQAKKNLIHGIQKDDPEEASDDN
jgi:hypothetical protein